MSKARGQSLKRSISRGSKGREKAITSKGEIIMKEPRIITEFVSTLGKLIILKRSSTGHNKVKTYNSGKTRRQRPYYQVVGQL